MFIDLVKIRTKAGDGGRGLVSFRREKHVQKGGPHGGDGGRGGNVIFRASKQAYDLHQFRFSKFIQATSGEAGGKQKKRGKTGQDTILKVPLGTLITDVEPSQVLADLVAEGQEVVVAKGGLGGFGNAHFKSSTQHLPLFAEKGLQGQDKEIICELKLLAEVGLIGLPNAGKSSFLQATTNARPKIGAYAFTTLEPYLGVSTNHCLIADLPGLISGAATGKGLGHQFLRHIERNLVLLHLIDVQLPDIVGSYQQIRQELAVYNPKLLDLPQLVALTKIDACRPELVANQQQLLSRTLAIEPVYAISALAQLNLKPLLKDLKLAIKQQRQRLSQAKTSETDTLTVFKIDPKQTAFVIRRLRADCFLVTGHKIETFAQKTDFSNYYARQHLLDIMRKLGIIRQLLALDYTTEKIVFGEAGIGELYLQEFN